MVAADAEPEFKPTPSPPRWPASSTSAPGSRPSSASRAARYISVDLDGLNVVLAPFDGELMLVLVGLPSALTCEYRLTKPGA